MMCERRVIIPEILKVNLGQVERLCCHLVLVIRIADAVTHWVLSVIGVVMGIIGLVNEGFLVLG